MAWVIALNVAGWPLIHFGMAWIFTRLPERHFAKERRWLRPRRAEAFIYQRLIGVRRWKRFLPDAAPWLRGVPKISLTSSESGYLRRFVAETRRGEAAHWAMLFAGAVFFLWNPPWADAIMICYATAANLPCIITQRYNRLRLTRVLRADSRRIRAA